MPSCLDRSFRPVNPVQLLLGYWVTDDHGNGKPALLPPFLYMCLRFKILRVLTGLRLCGQQKGRENRHLVRERWISQQAWVTKGFKTATKLPNHQVRARQVGAWVGLIKPQKTWGNSRERHIYSFANGVELNVFARKNKAGMHRIRIGDLL